MINCENRFWIFLGSVTEIQISSAIRALLHLSIKRTLEAWPSWSGWPNYNEWDHRSQKILLIIKNSLQCFSSKLFENANSKCQAHCTSKLCCPRVNGKIFLLSVMVSSKPVLCHVCCHIHYWSPLLFLFRWLHTAPLLMATYFSWLLVHVHATVCLDFKCLVCNFQF